MKFIKIVLIATFFLSFLFGCKKEKNTNLVQQSKAIELSPTTFDFIGQAHNNGLDYVFNNTFSKNLNSNFKDIKDASVKFVFEINNDTKLSKDNKSQFETQEFKKLIKKSTESNSIVLGDFNIQKNITPKQTAFINQLSCELTNTSHTYDVIIEKIILLEKIAIQDLGEDEIVYALCVSSLAKHSIEYWNTSKGEKWFKHFNKSFNPIGAVNNNNFAARIDYHNLAVADVLGFGAGFPSGVTVGMVAGGLTAGVASGGLLAGLGGVLGGLAGGTATGLAGAITASTAAFAAEAIVSWFE